MKKIIWIGLMTCLGFLAAPALLSAQQDRQQQFERIEAEKIAYITKELDITSKEAQRFFPIYNQYRKELMSMLQENRKKMRDQGKTPTRVDELEREAQLLAIKKKFREQFGTIIGESRASRFFEVEREFRAKLMQELRRRGN